jgi:hypothetical protein
MDAVNAYLDSAPKNETLIKNPDLEKEFGKAWDEIAAASLYMLDDYRSRMNGGNARD